MTVKNTIASMSAIVATGLFAASASAQITIDGNLDPAYGSALATQTVTTGFGDAGGNNDSAGGSELDAAYGSIQGANLDLFLAGNLENNGNHLNVFISGGAAGQSTLSLPATGTMKAMNGSQFSPGFQATYAFDANNYQGTWYSEEYNYAGTGALSGGYVGALGESSTGIAAGSTGGFVTLGINNNNASTMGPLGPAGTAYPQSQALAVTTGIEMSIPLSQIGYTGGAIEVLADVNGGNDGYLANQFLPGLPVGTGNLGTSGFNFSATPGEFFTVTPATVPEPSTLGLLGISALTFWRCRRRA